MVFFRAGDYLLSDWRAAGPTPGIRGPFPDQDWFGVVAYIPSPPIPPHGEGDPDLPPGWAALPPRERVVRCCHEVLAGGGMGFGLRGDFYRRFINCG